ncbi:MAG TPA: MarR family transcriptional regulator [Gammaproteobacteria bacterium]|nr:MarR family transcriptional regulator [Gammaproteobacteria bacterium]
MKPSTENSSAPATETFARLLGETGRTWRTRLDERLKPLGLSQAKWLALLYLHRGGDGMTQTRLAAGLGIEGATLTSLLDRLGRDGYVSRRESAHDRRSKTVHLTPAALKTIRKITAIAAELRGELLAGISARDLRVCIRTLQRIRAAADELSRKPRRREVSR